MSTTTAARTDVRERARRHLLREGRAVSVAQLSYGPGPSEGTVVVRINAPACLHPGVCVIVDGGQCRTVAVSQLPAAGCS